MRLFKSSPPAGRGSQVRPYSDPLASFAISQGSVASAELLPAEAIFKEVNLSKWALRQMSRAMALPKAVLSGDLHGGEEGVVAFPFLCPKHPQPSKVSASLCSVGSHIIWGLEGRLVTSDTSVCLQGVAYPLMAWEP